MGKSSGGDPEFVLSILDGDLEKEIVRLATSELSPEEIIAKLLELRHGD